MLHQATTLLQQGHAEKAFPLLQQYTKNHPNDAHGWYLLGITNHQQKKLQESLEALEHVFLIDPSNLQASNVKAVVLIEIGRWQEALQIYQQVLLHAPDNITALLNIAIVLEQNGSNNEALEYYDRAIKHQPHSYPAMLNRGALLLGLGRKREALHNNLQLVAINPESPDAHFNLAEAYLSLDQHEAALVVYGEVLSLQANMAKAHFGRGLALSMLRHFDEATQAFAKAKVIDPEIFSRSIRNAAALTGGDLREFSPHTIYLLKEVQRLQTCDWSHWEAIINQFESLLSCPSDTSGILCDRTLFFSALSLPISSASRFTLAKNIANRISEKLNTATYPALYSLYKQSIESGTKKIKVGYVSPDFRLHPVGILSRRLYALHDRKKFEIYGYSLHPGDSSQYRLDIEQGCDLFREISVLNDRRAAEIIHADGVDILIDLAGYTDFARHEIFAMRPAKLQVSYLGFPHTTGASYIDYFIGDTNIIKPEDEKFFSEKIAYLPDNFLIFDNQQVISPEKITRESLGLTAEGIVFCCHNSHYKITPDVFDSWMRILINVPESVLWLRHGSKETCANLRNEAEQRGVSSSRLIFSDETKNDIVLARYRLADLFLDTFHFNAISTGIEALWAGLPILTCTGESMSARGGSSLLSTVGLHEMITTSPEQYEEKAIYLATHPEELARIRKLLEHNRLTSPLFNTEQLVKNIESVYEHIWERHNSGLPPETFHLYKQR